MFTSLLFAILCIVLITSTFIIGHFAIYKVLHKYTDDLISQFFMASLFGFLLLVSSFSVCIRGIFSSLFPSFLLLILVMRKNLALKWPTFSRVHLTLCVTFLLWFFYCQYVFAESQDILFYSLVAKSFRLLKQENYFLVNNVLSDSFRFYTPYHYGEMWSSDLLNFFTGIAHKELLIKIIFPFSSFLTIIGITACVNSSIVPWRRIFISLTILFLTPTLISLFPSTVTSGFAIYTFDLRAISLNKALFFVPISVATAWWSGRSKVIAIALLCQIPLLSYTTFPAVYGGVFLFLSFAHLFKLFNAPEIKTLSLLLLSHVMCLGIVRILNSFSAAGQEAFMSDLLSIYLVHPHFCLLKIRNILVMQPIWLSISLIPAFVLSISFIRKPKRREIPLLFVPLCIGFTGLLAYALFFPHRDAVQLCYVPWIGICFPLFLGMFAPNFNVSLVQLLFLSAFVFLVSFWHLPKNSKETYSLHYFDQWNWAIKSPAVLKIGSIKKNGSLDAYYLYQQPLAPFTKIQGFLGCVPMAMPYKINKDFLDQFRRREISQESAFVEFCEKKYGSYWKMSKSDWEIACCDFLDQRRLEAVIIEKGAETPFCFAPRVKSMFIDSLSGDKTLFF